MPGAPADIVVHDLENLTIHDVEVAHDFPAMEWRRVQRASGYKFILVNGEVTIRDDQQTETYSGQLLQPRRGAGRSEAGDRRAMTEDRYMEGTIAAEIPLALAGAPRQEVAGGRSGATSGSRCFWTNADSGAWAVLYRWSKGYVAPPHRHLSDAHMLVLSGALKVRDGCFGPGDYGYEPKGAVHGPTTDARGLRLLVHLQRPDPDDRG